MDKFIFEDEVAYLPEHDVFRFSYTEIDDSGYATSDNIIRELCLWTGDRVRITIEKI